MNKKENSEKGSKKAKMKISAEKFIEAIEKVTTDPYFRARLEAKPKEALEELDIEIDDEQANLMAAKLSEKITGIGDAGVYFRPYVMEFPRTIDPISRVRTITPVVSDVFMRSIAELEIDKDKFIRVLDRITVDPEFRSKLDREPVEALEELGVQIKDKAKAEDLRKRISDFVKTQEIQRGAFQAPQYGVPFSRARGWGIPEPMVVVDATARTPEFSTPQVMSAAASQVGSKAVVIPLIGVGVGAGVFVGVEVGVRTGNKHLTPEEILTVIQKMDENPQLLERLEKEPMEVLTEQGLKIKDKANAEKLAKHIKEAVHATKMQRRIQTEAYYKSMQAKAGALMPYGGPVPPMSPFPHPNPWISGPLVKTFGPPVMSMNRPFGPETHVLVKTRMPVISQVGSVNQAFSIDPNELAKLGTDTGQFFQAVYEAAFDPDVRINLEKEPIETLSKLNIKIEDKSNAKKVAEHLSRVIRTMDVQIRAEWKRAPYGPSAPPIPYAAPPVLPTPQPYPQYLPQYISQFTPPPIPFPQHFTPPPQPSPILNTLINPLASPPVVNSMLGPSGLDPRLYPGYRYNPGYRLNPQAVANTLLHPMSEPPIDPYSLGYYGGWY